RPTAADGLCHSAASAHLHSRAPRAAHLHLRAPRAAHLHSVHPHTAHLHSVPRTVRPRRPKAGPGSCFTRAPTPQLTHRTSEGEMNEHTHPWRGHLGYVRKPRTAARGRDPEARTPVVGMGRGQAAG